MTGNDVLAISARLRRIAMLEVRSVERFVDEDVSALRECNNRF